MPAECNTSGTLALVLSWDVKFVNTGQIITYTSMLRSLSAYQQLI